MKNQLTRLRRIVLLLLLVSSALLSFAQANFRVSGKVTDATGQPVEGATVQEEGTRNQTQTGKNGSFSLSASCPITNGAAIAAIHSVAVPAIVRKDKREASSASAKDW